eukprot:2244207-Alexandrium_andersonii.AAC.1
MPALACRIQIRLSIWLVAVLTMAFHCEGAVLASRAHSPMAISGGGSSANLVVLVARSARSCWVWVCQTVMP